MKLLQGCVQELQLEREAAILSLSNHLLYHLDDKVVLVYLKMKIL